MIKNALYNPSSIAKTCLTTSFGYVVVQLDITIVNVAMPSIGQTYSANLHSLQWIADAYVVVFAALLISAGVLCDKYGSRKIYFIGLLLFFISSLVCAFSPTIRTLIIARIIQGVAAALILPASLSLLALSTSESDHARIKAIGWWSAIGGFVSATGPFIGGVLIDLIHWRAIFLINIPICLVGLLLTPYLLEESPLQKNKSLDVKGQLYAIVSVLSIIWAMIEAGKSQWSNPLIYVSLFISIFTLMLFIRQEKRVSNPMFPLELFKISRLFPALLVGLVINFAFYGVIFILSIYMQYVRKYSPTLTGLALMTFVVIMFANLFSAYLAKKFGEKNTVILGLIITSLAYLLITLVMVYEGSYLLLVLSLILMPIGTGVALPTLLALFISSVSKQMVGTASAIINSFRQLGSALGIAILGMFIVGNTSTINHGAITALVISAILMLMVGVFFYLFVQQRNR
ncbi:MFS transporter [Providencia sp. PROV194]|uniref:MFS transporter n=1 Tax=Providencia sp. PROV194 TaxID=2949895 RepID=UPI00234A05F8|nr:MFS transporter [Providencia sp. PROV194]